VATAHAKNLKQGGRDCAIRRLVQTLRASNPSRISDLMKPMKMAPVALCLALGACASVPPSAPTVTAMAGPNVPEKKFVQDDAACRARAYGSVEQAAAVAGQFGLQGQYNNVYSQCMIERGGYTIEQPVPRYYAPGPYLYGPGPYVYAPGPYYGPTFYYGWGWSAGWGRRW
jgi:hypothetical protein